MPTPSAEQFRPSAEQESLAHALEMARPRRRRDQKPVELTPDQDKLISDLIDRAKDAEKAGDKIKAIELYRQCQAELDRIKQEKKKAKEFEKIPENMREIVEQAQVSLEQGLNDRFQEFGSDLEFKISSPEIPENLTPEHLELIAEVFGKETFKPTILPKPEDLHNLDEEYQGVMYPKTQTEKDKEKGLVSYRPDWFDQASDKDITKSEETWGEAYVRSIKQELNKIGNSLVLYETTQKPNYTDGKQHYGTTQGNSPEADPLLPIFQQAFGEGANRFNHSHDELQEKLIPLIKQKIQEKFQEKGLSMPDPALPSGGFEVILAPALAFNLDTTLFHPENSKTNTSEWTSTVLTDIDENDSGHRLFVGCSDDGGAADVNDNHRGNRWHNFWGARLAVVFSKTWSFAPNTLI